MILKKNILDIFFILSIFLLDRISKLLIINYANFNDEFNLEINSFISFNLIWNNGIAFGLFSFDQAIYYNLLTAIILLIIVCIIWFIKKAKGVEKIALTMILGGSLGNVYDRILYSSVPDFIDIHFYNLHWFIFNVADIFISIGVIMLIYLEIFNKKKT
tara:strand:- start:689 stop:1165 length:477 start_codon:yes stop_codon:yes gene_type:complete